MVSTLGTVRDGSDDYCARIMLIRPVPNPEQYTRVWEQYVAVLNGEYAMSE